MYVKQIVSTTHMSIPLRLLSGLAMEARIQQNRFHSYVMWPMIFPDAMFHGVQVDGLGVVNETAIEAGSW